jgi:hypothetical protein
MHYIGTVHYYNILLHEYVHYFKDGLLTDILINILINLIHACILTTTMIE